MELLAPVEHEIRLSRLTENDVPSATVSSTITTIRTDAVAIAPRTIFG